MFCAHQTKQNSGVPVYECCNFCCCCCFGFYCILVVVLSLFEPTLYTYIKKTIHYWSRVYRTHRRPCLVCAWMRNTILRLFVAFDWFSMVCVCLFTHNTYRNIQSGKNRMNLHMCVRCMCTHITRYTYHRHINFFDRMKRKITYTRVCMWTIYWAVWNAYTWFLFS